MDAFADLLEVFRGLTVSFRELGPLSAQNAIFFKPLHVCATNFFEVCPIWLRLGSCTLVGLITAGLHPR